MRFGRRSRPSTTVLVHAGREPAFDGDDELLDGAIELGSLTKALSGIVLAGLDRRGELPLTTAVTDVLDLDTTLRCGDQVVTIEHLATHHSGLPRLGEHGRVDPDDPYRDIDESEVVDEIRRLAASGPGEATYEYSNLGFAVVGLCIARVAGSWPQAMRDHLLDPLGVEEVWPGPPPDGAERVTARNRRGRPVSWWSMGGYAAAGACTGTARGVGALLRGLIDADPRSEVGGDLRTAIRPRRTIDGGSIGLGWHLASTGQAWHNGATGGFSAFAAFSTGLDRAVARLAVGPPNDQAEREAGGRIVDP
ncbi:MAG: serine hydrolase domain-containing protein [Actinomycetota bacterium]